MGARIEGDLDSANGKDLVEFVDEIVSEAGQRVEVDLSRVVFIDRYGLQALLDTRRLAEERQAELLLVEPSGQVRRLLELTGRDQIFTVVSSRHEAPADGARAVG